MTHAAIIVQRYGADIVGGAESHARQIAERLNQDLDWQVSVCTTTCRAYETWAPSYEAGCRSLNGIDVHRFHPDKNRSRWFSLFNRLVTPIILRLPPTWQIRNYLEERWFDLQGPQCRALHKFVIDQQKKFDVIIFFSAIYPTTNGLITQLNAKTVIVPTLHDEPALYFGRVRRSLEAAGNLFMNSTAEAALVKKICAHPPACTIVGLGFDQLSEDDSKVTTLPCPDPYLIYLGRIGKGKRIQDLVDGYELYRKQFPSDPLKLVLVGQQDLGFHLRSNDNIILTGYLDENLKNAYIKNAVALVSASQLESLSMILFEAIELGTPAMMSNKSPLMRDFAKKMPAVSCFDDHQDFAQKLHLLRQTWQTDPHTGDQQINASRNWARQHFSWEKVLKNYANLA